MPSNGPLGHYEVRDHPSIADLLNIHWCPDTGPSAIMVTIGADRVPLLAEALTEYELAHSDPPPRAAGGGLRVIREDGKL
jgi:hypothetical protein